MSKIHLIDGEKGGVGKSFFAKTLIEYFLANKQTYTLIDADQSNPDVHHLYPERGHQLIFSDVEAKYHLTDIIFELALNTTVIVNLPAQVQDKLQGWLERSNIFDICTENNVEICRWFVSNGGYDSIKLFKETLPYYGNAVSNVFVKNLGMTEDWTFLKEDVEFSNLCQKYSANLKVIEFARCNIKERYDMEKLQLSLSQALNSDQFTILAKQRLLNFKKASFQAIDAVAPLVSASTELIEVITPEEVAPKTTSKTTRTRSSKKKAASATSK
jgi:hypothetical protein